MYTEEIAFETGKMENLFRADFERLTEQLSTAKQNHKLLDDHIKVFLED